MTPFDFEYLRKLLKDRSGLMLSADKQYLVESRLLPIARKAGVNGLGGLVQRMRESGAERLTVEVVEAMTTNETFFFRDKIPFEHFRDTMMPALLAARSAQRRIRIWCAAASTGQEPYSLAMMLKEMGSKVAGWRIEILATDLATDVLEKAKVGTYTQFEVQRGLPIQLLVKYFEQKGDTWQIVPAIRAMVDFRSANLLQNLTHLGTFDVVFCRNVLIYFDQPTKIDVFERIARIMAPDGFLSLGAAETVVGLTDTFKPVADKRGLYAPTRIETGRFAERRSRLLRGRERPALAAERRSTTSSLDRARSPVVCILWQGLIGRHATFRDSPDLRLRPAHFRRTRWQHLRNVPTAECWRLCRPQNDRPLADRRHARDGRNHRFRARRLSGRRLCPGARLRLLAASCDRLRP